MTKVKCNQKDCHYYKGGKCTALELELRYIDFRLRCETRGQQRSVPKGTCPVGKGD